MIDACAMFIHYHSLLGGGLAFAIVFFIAPTWTCGLPVLLICLLLELGGIVDSVQKKQQVGFFVLSVLVQAWILFAIFLFFRFYVFGV